jgi:hypothetical protein
LWHGHVSFISLSQVDRFLLIERHKHKTPLYSQKRGFDNQTWATLYWLRVISWVSCPDARTF